MEFVRPGESKYRPWFVLALSLWVHPIFLWAACPQGQTQVGGPITTTCSYGVHTIFMAIDPTGGACASGTVVCHYACTPTYYPGVSSPQCPDPSILTPACPYPPPGASTQPLDIGVATNIDCHEVGSPNPTQADFRYFCGITDTHYPTWFQAAQTECLQVARSQQLTTTVTGVCCQQNLPPN